MARLVVADKVDEVFSDAAVAAMAKACRLPAYLDLRVLAAGVRDAVRIYLSALRTPRANDLHWEVRHLHMAARHKYYRRLATLLTSLSPLARDHLNSRGLRPGLSTTLPDPADLTDPDRRDDACDAVRRLCTMGGQVFHGRIRRSTGNRRRQRKGWLFVAVKKERRDGKKRRSSPVTREYGDVLYAPALETRPERHGPERELLMWLRVAWLEASGKMPPSSPDRHVDTPGPFTRLLKWVLEECGRDDVSAVELISSVPIPKSEGNKHS